MNDLHTIKEYTDRAKNLSLQNKAFINGIFVDSLSGETFLTTNPATDEVLTQIASCDEKDVDLAVQAARSVFDRGNWSQCSPTDRKEVLLKFADLIEQDTENLSLLESIDSGKPIAECLAVDVPDTVQTIRWHAEAIDKIYDYSAPTGSQTTALIVREPIGVVGCVLPWNFPLLMLAWKLGPALASGCSVVVKPAEQTTLTSLRIAELAVEAGLPAGVLNIVTGTGPSAGEPIGRHHDVDMVSFTGSTATGRLFLKYAAETNLKKVVLECGGKNPAVVFDDAEDLQSVAEHILNGAFWNMGENCSATSRLLVQEGVKDELLEIIADKMNLWTLGDPLDPKNNLGTLIDKTHFDKVNSYLKQAKKEGLSLLHGGNTVEGRYIEPTIFHSVSPQSSLYTDEIFGPVLCITTFKTEEEAIQLANDTSYGLAASVYTSNLRKALKLSRAIRAGTVTVNSFGEGNATTPFGGYKESGFGGRDKSIFAHDQYTELKTIWIDI